MKLFLASEAKHPDSLPKLEQFVGGFADKKIAYIPTASNGESTYGAWQTESGSWKLVQTLSPYVEPVVLEDYKNERVIDHLRNKDIIWVAGGVCGYLMYWMRRCQVDKHLKKILDTGTIYVGSSAGSMVCSPTLTLSEHYLGDNEHGASVIPGLGLIDFDIFPHFEDTMLNEIKRTYHGNRLYLLKNGEAITIDDGALNVVGEKRIMTT